jgi:glycosyltransferase involved in cell wall biosynthesis
LPNVVVLPFQAQAGLRDYYQAADVLVLPSTGEGFPLVVMEAMVCGTPAIVSDETYAAWNDGREHFLVCDSSVDAVQALLHGPHPARETIAAYARAQWDWDAVAREYVRLFEEML